jgi:iduronate 2-sulfatase
MYDRGKIELAKWQKNATNGPEISYPNAGEVRGFKDIENLLKEAGVGKNDAIKLSVEKQRELIHGYYACVSYMDAQLGRILKTLKDEGLDKNTIIVFWGDHGWHFGDHNLWAKHSNFEQATKAPLLISVPGMTTGKVYTQPTEFVDIFPTLCELTNLKVPSYLDGTSLVPALKDNKVKIKDFAISQYPRKHKGKDYMGYSIRTEKYRYTEWLGPNYTTEKPYNESAVFASELYDLVNDPDETVNIAGKAEAKKDLKKVQEQLHDYYQQQHKTAGKIN